MLLLVVFIDSCELVAGRDNDGARYQLRKRGKSNASQFLCSLKH